MGSSSMIMPKEALTFIILFTIIFLIFWIVIVVGTWLLFKKSGEKGWKAIVPFYSDYTLFKLLDINTWWLLLVWMLPVLVFVPVVGIVMNLVYKILFAKRLAEYYPINGRPSTAMSIVLAVLVGTRVPVVIFGMSGSAQYISTVPQKRIYITGDSYGYQERRTSEPDVDDVAEEFDIWDGTNSGKTDFQ